MVGVVAAPGTAPLVTLAALIAAGLVAGEYLNPDGAAYLSLADQWAAGAFDDAVSGYWGPLYSWLLVPVLRIGVEPLVAVRVVLGLAAVLVVVISRRLLDRAGLRPAWAGAGTLAVAPVAVWSASFGAYPETLLIAALLAYCLALGDPMQASARRLAAAGALGGIAYLCKAAALPLITGHLILVLLVAAVTRRTTAVRRLLAALVGLAVVAGPWIGVLSATYDRPTFSTAVGFNDDLVGSRGNPLLYAGLYPLPFDDARSAWDDPTETIDATRWAPPGDLDLPAEQRTRPERLVDSVRVALGSLGRRVPVALVLAAATVLLAWRRLPPVLVSVVLLAAGTTAGYAVVLVIERYLWFTMIALTLVATFGASLVPADAERRRRALTMTLLTGVIATSWLGSGQAMLTRLGDHQELDAIAAEHTQLDGARVVATDAWAETLAVCVRADCAYLGKIGDADLVDIDDLRLFDIDYVVDVDASEPAGQVMDLDEWVAARAAGE
ncbi:glycosyltransferase family 39 protein [Euzebya tangerina]|uniref:glycosyltransferase family 39 protein n=1 Tax=Euzebya tangerina TaxID=591198 RepID=UPI0013C37547|nr:glycosyltransferase family 39 protein [Euzebya tangerina]